MTGHYHPVHINMNDTALAFHYNTFTKNENYGFVTNWGPPLKNNTIKLIENQSPFNELNETHFVRKHVHY